MRLIAKTIITVYLLCTLICCGHKQKEATREYSMMQIDSVTCQYRCAMGEGILRLVSVTDSTNRIEHLKGDSVVDSWALDYPAYRFLTLRHQPSYKAPSYSHVVLTSLLYPGYNLHKDSR